MKKIVTSGAASNDAILSQAIEVNGLVFVSGQIHADVNWQLVGDSSQDKFKACMKNVATILEAAGCSLESIVKVTIFTTDMSTIPEINEIYEGYFGDILPAREAIGVAALPLGASIEVVVVAAK